MIWLFLLTFLFICGILMIIGWLDESFSKPDDPYSDNQNYIDYIDRD